ncbi:MAG: GDSL-type esterase/lipase family protein [Sulfuricurvum sp.]|nr:GDSL-type esterase/lipase family protein [Sulfuricurvum sp.]
MTPKIPPKELKATATILAFGDSLTFGYGVLPHESYPARLEQRIHRKVINAGIPGELSDEGAKRLPSMLEMYHPDVLLLCHGGNDILQKKSEASVRHNIEHMVRLAQTRHIDVILIGVPKFSLLHLSSLPLYKEIAKQYHLPIEADILPYLLRNNHYKHDWIHPNANGYEKMAEAIEKVLRDQYRFKESE